MCRPLDLLCRHHCQRRRSVFGEFGRIQGGSGNVSIKVMKQVQALYLIFQFVGIVGIWKLITGFEDREVEGYL